MTTTPYVLRKRFARLAAVILLLLGGLLAAPSALADDPLAPLAPSGESAWDALKRQQPGVVNDRTITALERKILQVLSPDQAEAYLGGGDPELILLPGGETLASFIARIESEEAAGLVYHSITPCLVADSRRAQGKLADAETRTLLVRGPEADYTFQGGDAAGCGIPGMTGEELRSNAVRALVLNVELLDADGPGELRMWAANDHPRPPVSMLAYGQGEPPASAYHTLVVPVCDEESPEPCPSGDLKVQTTGAGAHLAVSVLGYFETAGGDKLLGLWMQRDVHIFNTNPGNVGIGTSTPRGRLHARGVWARELLLEAAEGDPDVSLAEAGDLRAQIKYLIAEDGLAFLTDDQHVGFGGLAESSQTKLFISGTSDNVGIGTANPTSRLTVAGTVHATAGGFRFPDGSLQTHAGAVAPSSVGSLEVIDNSLTAADLAPGSVGASELRSNAVSSSKVVDNSLTAADLAPGSVGASEIATGAVGGDEVLDGSLTGADLEANCVGGDKVMDNSLTAADLATGAVGTLEIADGSIAYSDVAWPLAGAVESRGVEVQNGAAERRAATSVVSDAGFSATYGANGSRNVGLSFMTADPSLGAVVVNDAGGESRALMLVSPTTHGGAVLTQGPNGHFNARITSLNGYEDHGFIAVYDAAGNQQAGMYVDPTGRGVVFGDIKSFRVRNPDDPGSDIWYASLEGPEAAVFVRGTARLVRGRAAIELPAHFRAVAAAQGLTVSLTPLSAESKGLAVVAKRLYGIEVRELAGGDGAYEFDYTVTAVRKGHEGFRVVRPAAEARQAEGPAELDAHGGD